MPEALHMAVSPASGKVLTFLGRIAYGLAAGVGALRLAMLAISLAGPHLENGAAWEVMVLGWRSWGPPATTIACVLSSVVVFPLYRSSRSWGAAATIFTLNLLAVTAVILGLAAWAGGLMRLAS